MDCLTPVRDEDGLLLGLVLFIVNRDGEDIYISTVKDNREMKDLETAIEHTKKLAHEDMSFVHSMNRVLALKAEPITEPLDEELINYLSSSYYKGSKLGVSLYADLKAKNSIFVSSKHHGSVYLLKNGKWVNEYRPVEFNTVLEATQDLVGLTNPTEYVLMKDE
jgi:hypothetical protein